MDLNQLYFDHQILLMRATAASSDQLRLLHRDNASKVARHIEGIHIASRATASRNWQARNDQSNRRAVLSLRHD